MTGQASRVLRWSRASLLGLVVLVVGSVAHASADGLLPGPGRMVALYVVCVLGCAMFLGREASALRLTALVVGGQGFVHTGLAAMAGHQGEALTPHVHATASAPVVPWDPRSGQSYGAWEQQNFTHGTSPELALPSWLTHAVTDLLAHPVMALAHVLAAVAVGAWLAVGERALWSLLRMAAATALQLADAVRVRLDGVPAVLLSGVRRLPLPDTELDPVPQRPVWSRGPARRGPPQLLPAR